MLMVLFLKFHRIDCVGILKLRNADIELRNGETDIGRKNTRVRLVFRVHIPQPGGQLLSLQVASDPVECCKECLIPDKLNFASYCWMMMVSLVEHGILSVCFQYVCNKHRFSISNETNSCFPAECLFIIKSLKGAMFAKFSLMLPLRILIINNLSGHMPWKLCCYYYSCLVINLNSSWFLSPALSTGASCSWEAGPGPMLSTWWTTNGPHWTKLYTRLQGDILWEDTRWGRIFSLKYLAEQD